MIVGIGIDSVEVNRFAAWQTYCHKKLSKIFGPEEIAYCLQYSVKSAERFAVRFAAKEAFYKALCTAIPTLSIPFLRLTKYVELRNKVDGMPYLYIDWKLMGFEAQGTTMQPWVSLTHTKKTATAMVILEKFPVNV